VNPAGDQQQQLAYVPTPPHTPATTHQENNDDGEDVPMDDDLAEEEKATDLRSKANSHEKKNVKRVNWEKTEDTKKSHPHMRDNNNKNRTGSHEAPRQQQQWRPKTNNSTTQPTNYEVPKGKKKEQEEKKGQQRIQQETKIQQQPQKNHGYDGTRTDAN